MAEGNVFFIKSQMHGKVLDVQGEGTSPGTPVIVWDQKDSGNQNQLWYEDRVCGTIRSMASHHCLDTEDGGVSLIINEFSGSDSQKWSVDGETVRNGDGRALDIEGASHDSGARVCSWDCHGEINQQWVIEYLPARYFFIRSRMNGRVLDVKGADEEDGADVITYDQHEEPSDNQLWYQDKRGFIRSKLNDMIWDSSDKKIEMEEYEEGKEDQMWVPLMNENKIVNAANPSLAIDIKGAKDENKAKIIKYEFHGGDNQLWDFEYI